MEQKVILLDDDIDDLEPLENYLKERGITNLFSFTDAEEAIKEATVKSDSKRKMLITFVTDYHLLNTNGLEVMKRVLQTTSTIHFIHVSNKPTVSILLPIINLCSGFYFRDKNEDGYFETVYQSIVDSQTGLERKTMQVIEMERERLERERQDLDILLAAAETLKILAK